MELLDTEIDSICNYIIYDLNQYIGEELGHTLIYDDLIQKNEVFYSDAISKLVVGNSVKVNLSESIDNLYKDKILYGNKYFLIDNFKISIRVSECSLIYKNETDTLHVLLFKYNISFSEDLNDKIYILKMS